MDAILHGEVPEHIKREWNTQREVLAYKLSKEEDALRKERAELDKEKATLERAKAEYESIQSQKEKTVEELSRKLNALEIRLQEEEEGHEKTRKALELKDLEVKAIEQELSEVCEQLNRVPEKIDEAKNKVVRGFLTSSSFELAAKIKIAPIFRQQLTDVMTALATHYPFSAEEFKIYPPDSAEPTEMGGYIWREEEDELLGPEGGLAEEPFLCPSPVTLAKCNPKHVWPADDWPEDMLPPDPLFETPEHNEEEFDPNQFFVDKTPKQNVGGVEEEAEGSRRDRKAEGEARGGGTEGGNGGEYADAEGEGGGGADTGGETQGGVL